MPITVQELWDSREHQIGEDASIDLRFVVSGTDDDVAAHTELLNVAPVLYAGLVRQSSHLERLAETTWQASVRYGIYEPPQTGDSSYNFETGGGTQHVTQSLGTVGAWAAPGLVPPNFHGAIGVGKDSIDGVDITVPVYNFGETHYLPAAAVTPGYKAALFRLTGTVNAFPFRGFDVGEVLFLGASGSKRGQDDWEIAYKFAASPNALGLSVGSITGINKRGWDYLWVRYADVEDSSAKMLVQRPIAAYVEQVYPYRDFSGLGIGV